MNRKQGFDLHEISAARPFLLGLATLWIALFHSYSLDFFQSGLLEKAHLVGLLNRLKETGNCGVDLFLFFSGLGLVYSWEKLRETSDRPLREFYGRRFSRILPPVLLVTLAVFGLKGAPGGFHGWAGQVFLFGIFLPGQAEVGYWYFSLLIPLYLLFPLLYRLTARRTAGAGAAALAAEVLAAAALTLLTRHFFPDYFRQTEIMLTRIPVFLLGIGCGRLCRAHVRIPGWVPAACLLPAAAGLFVIPSLPLPELYLYRWAYLPWALCIILGVSWLCSLPARKGPVYRLVCLTGGFSLEIYLIYERLYMADPPLFHSADAAGFSYALTVFAASLLLSALLRGATGILRGEYRPGGNGGKEKSPQ